MLPASFAHSPPSEPATPRMRPISLPDEDTLTPPIVEIASILSPTSTQPYAHDFSSPVDRSLNALHDLNDLPATDPPQIVLNIHCPRIRQNIRVAVDDTNFVSMADILSDIHRYLHGAASPGDIAMPENSGAQAQYLARCSGISDTQTRNIELQQGIKKVDLLMGAHHFAGLVKAGHCSNVWELRLRE